jgi:transposase
MESCATAHHWGRKFSEAGFTVKLISPAFVKPYVRGNKNDRNDSEAIVEAARRPGARFIQVKKVEQQEVQSYHRARSLQIKQRTACANHLRSILAEFGFIIPQGITTLRKAVPDLLEDAENSLTPGMRELIAKLYDNLKHFDDEVQFYNARIKQFAGGNVHSRRLMKLPGIGPLTASALVSAVGDAQEFKSGRELAAWLGLTPRHTASGEQCQIGGISKRGDRYLRTLLTHGARSVVYRCKDKPDKRSRWIAEKSASRGHNKAVVALAHKTAREAWAVLRKQEQFIF